MKKVRTKLKFNIAFHPQINGPTKRVNGILNQYLCNYIVDDHKDWGNHLGLLEFCYKSTKHSITKMNPFELALGVEVKQPIDLTIPRTRDILREGSKQAEEMAKECDERKTRAIKLLEKVHVSYVKQANKLQMHIKFKVRDLMWLNIKDFKVLLFQSTQAFIRSFANPTMMCILCNFQ
jgi:hypothetical protein